MLLLGADIATTESHILGLTKPIIVKSHVKNVLNFVSVTLLLSCGELLILTRSSFNFQLRTLGSSSLEDKEVV